MNSSTQPIRRCTRSAKPLPRMPPRRERKKQREEALMLVHLPQVRIIAKKIRSRMRWGVELDDLIGYGTLGLIQAVKRFDSSRGVLLKTYAEHRIRGAILDGLREMNWLSRSAVRRKARYQECCSTVSGATSYAASEATSQAASDPNSKSDNPIFAVQSGGMPDSVNHPIDSSVEPPLLEIVCGGWNLEELEKLSGPLGRRLPANAVPQDPAALYERKEVTERLDEALLQLPKRDRSVLELYHRRELSMKQIGAIFNLHQSRISQLHSQAIRRLRSYYSATATESDRTPELGMKPLAGASLINV